MPDRFDDGTARAGDAPIALPEVLQFMRLVWALTQGLDRRSHQMRRAIGITGPQRLTVRIIGLNPGLSAGRLAEILHVHPSTLTGTLRRLVARRVVARTRDPIDRRRAVLQLTAHGARINRRTRGTVEVAVASALGGITDVDRRAARRVLERLTGHLNGTRRAAAAIHTRKPKRSAST